MNEMLEEVQEAIATADPEVASEASCVVLNVNGDCLDHLEWGPGTSIFFCKNILANITFFR